jgi:recombination protein RecR
MDSIEKLTTLFEKFPGIGPRQARRFVQYLLAEKQTTRGELAESIKQLGSNTAQCKECFRWYVKTESSKPSICNICNNSHRDHGTIFVVEKDADIDNVERSGFKGLYFVLGGTIPLATEEPEKHVRLRELVKRVEVDASEKKIKEIILGLSATTEGDHTRLLLQEKLLPMSEGLEFKVSSLGRGLSTGSELEYADPDTIASALSSRT